MNQLGFVAAAYGVVIAATLALIMVSWRAMRRAEAAATAAPASAATATAASPPRA